MQETLRRYPPLPVIPRTTLRDFEYTDSYLTPEQVRQHTASLTARG